MQFNKIHPRFFSAAIIFIAAMKHPNLFLVSLIFCCTFFTSRAQQINGVIQDRESKTPLANVQLSNVYNGKTVFTDSLGHFTIAADRGQLIEIRYAGYSAESIRLSRGTIPPYFKIYLDKIAVLNPDRYASSGLSEYQIDSIKNRELYGHVLDFRRLTAFESIESPFSALSKSNNEKWRFQESYAMFEQEKYIDYTFNETLVKQITGLEDGELQRYMKRYRPSYEALRSMSLYDFYSYIRATAERFKHKPPTPRNSF
ncbi:MAG TPA: hypothetical protein VL092_00105 [Chitinophagaceae bacterium]|nr:hypothetical protein [Chitinophagaceae bacterium]